MERDLTTNEHRLLELLHQHGSLGNAKARQHLGWDQETYNVAKDGLYAQGLLAIGRGRGGSVRPVHPKVPDTGKSEHREA